jgi:isocitrate dehydrogenase
MSRPGCERIARYAFEYARANGRHKVTCMTKANIMKLTDGLFRRVFEEVAAEYPEIEAEHLIVDIGAARLATRPTAFDVVLAPNLYGDILSDIAAEVAGSIGLAGSANVGEGLAMFEAVHGSAPDIAGQDVANPSGLLLAAVMMLVHLGQGDVAERVHNAWLRTLEDGFHPADIFRGRPGEECAGTAAFADAVIARLGQRPKRLKPVTYASAAPTAATMVRPTIPARKTRRGVDVFVHWTQKVEDLAGRLRAGEAHGLRLEMITNRGVRVWPEGFPETLLTDHWRCRFVGEGDVAAATVPALLAGLVDAGLDVIKTEGLYAFDGEIGYSLGQNQ